MCWQVTSLGCVRRDRNISKGLFILILVYFGVEIPAFPSCWNCCSGVVTFDPFFRHIQTQLHCLSEYFAEWSKIHKIVQILEIVPWGCCIKIFILETSFFIAFGSLSRNFIYFNAHFFLTSKHFVFSSC